MLQFRQGDERLVLAHLTRWWRQRRKPNPRIKAEAIMLEITPAAQDYIAEKLAKEPAGSQIRIGVEYPGTQRAQVNFALCPQGQEEPTDTPLAFDDFYVYVQADSAPYLKDAVVDYKQDTFGGQLSVQAPYAKAAPLNENSSLSEQINHILHTDVNPSLAAHGGFVSLVELTEDNIAVLQFGGGCQGCGMVDTTLKDGVAKALQEQLSELNGVRDVTDHSVREHAYYK